mmetsp:Transcript_36229/g.73006  ORF Transcript_36229/g.73006 Transcript_36229/m.73006 type:complete len:248 (+) Transcript_36229:292-1035(+)
MTCLWTSSKCFFSLGISSKRQVGQELLFFTHDIRHSSWNLWPQGIDLAFEPAGMASWQTTQRSSSTTVTTRSSLRASRDMPGLLSSSSTRIMPLAAKSSFMVTRVLASLNRPLLCILSSRTFRRWACSLARSRASSSTSSMAASRHVATPSNSGRWKSSARKKSRPACQNFGFEKRVWSTRKVYLPASPSACLAPSGSSSTRSHSPASSRQAATKVFFAASSFWSAARRPRAASPVSIWAVNCLSGP